MTARPKTGSSRTGRRNTDFPSTKSRGGFYPPEKSAERRTIDEPLVEKDFNKAYNKLVEKIYSEQGSNILVSPEELAKVEN